MRSFYTNHPDVISLAKRAYPDYGGKTYRVAVAECPINVKSYWDGGSRSYFKFIRLDMRLDGASDTIEVPQQSAFDKQIEGAEHVQLVPGLACVEHSYLRGKDMGIRVYVHPDNAPKLLPPPTELAEDEYTVLKYTAHLKNTYGGRTNIRYTEAHRETGITVERWEAAKTVLIGKKLLIASGAITGEGRNAVKGVI
jgi:hypothetical protein